MKPWKKHSLIFCLCCLFSLPFSRLSAQQKIIPLQQYYKINFLKYSGKNTIESFYPVNESQLMLSDSLYDSTVFYYDFFVWLFKRNWVEIKQKEGSLEINPLIDLSYGKSLSGQDSLPLYRNTRGVSVKGEFLNKIAFSFAFCENQSRFQGYESQYFRERGELYDNGDYYQKVNAVIPAGARTKPFKTDAFDYAFSYGAISYQLNPKLRVEAGNNQHFIGSGYRSLLLSDNAVYAPYLRLNWKITPQLSYQLLYRKHRNLFRKPVTLAVESAYENKFFAANYLTWKPARNFALSLFTAGNQLRADSIRYHSAKPQMFVPLPLFNTDLLFDSGIINGIAGLNFDLAFRDVTCYAQLAVDKYRTSYLAAFQAGAYYFDAFGVDNLNFQLELNSVPDNFYASDNVKLSYSQYNLPLAHVKGNNFTEIYGNINYELKRFYMSYSFVRYQSRGGDMAEQIYSNSIFTAAKDFSSLSKGTTLVQTHEIGYRINHLYNPALFIRTQLRMASYGEQKINNSFIMAGLKVSLHNQYLDF